MVNNFPHTTAALEVYDEGVPERERLFNSVHDQRSFDAWEKAEGIALRKVQRAFWRDTRGINSLANCQLLSIHDLRRYKGH